MPRRHRQRPYPAPDGHRAAQVGRVAPGLDDLQVTLVPALSQAITHSELVAVERILSPALLDLLSGGDRDSIVIHQHEAKNAEP